MESNLPSSEHPPASRALLDPPAFNDPKARLAWMTVELAARRTGMAFQRTRMSADRTLMAVMRTALSLITFGFTLFHALQQLHGAQIVQNARSPQLFATALAVLGVGMLLVGIGYQVAFMLGLRSQRARMQRAGLVHAESDYPISLSLLIALALLAIGILALLSILFNVGPFG